MAASEKPRLAAQPVPQSSPMRDADEGEMHCRADPPAPRGRYLQHARYIDLIVVHCTATKATQDYTREQLWRDHVKGRGWKDIGYHIYIRRDGTIEMCRPLSQAGAHAKGYNAHSIGVAWEGGIDQLGHPEDNRTAEQVVTMWQVLEELLQTYPAARLVGHHDLNPHKACPCLDVDDEYRWLIQKYCR